MASLPARFSLALASALALPLLGACGSPVPKAMESTFSMSKDSLAFPNFATGYDASALDAELMKRMFGDAVCVTPASPCVLTARAASFVEQTNAAMSGGRCEGFAVLASLLHERKLDPKDFGAEQARDLVLDNNPALQRELAYWFATQMVPKVTAAQTKTYMAKDVMPAVVEALKADAKERYRIGIVRKKGKAITGGHSLTPFAYFSDAKNDGVYWLRVYDNNNPKVEGKLRIDTKKNRWEFEASPLPSQKSRLYFGDDSNKNPLYFAPIYTRLGTLPCPFCETSGQTVLVTHGGAQASINASSGPVGIIDGELTASGSNAVSPSFSAELDTEPLSAVIAVNGDDVPSTLQTTITAPLDEENVIAEQGLSLISKTLNVSATGLTVTQTDTLSTNSDGTKLSFENNSRTNVTLTTEVTTASGSTVKVAASVSGQSSKVTTDVDPMTGKISVGASDSMGAVVTVAVEATKPDGTSTSGQVTYTSQGDSSVTTSAMGLMTNGSLEGEVTNNGMTMTVASACENGLRDGTETDVDCGGACMTKCEQAQRCKVGADCLSTYCRSADGTCVATSCADGIKSGQETAVDCGGAECATCAAGKACTANADCATGACVTSVCTDTWAIGVSVSGLPSGAEVVLQNNGSDDLTAAGDGSFAFATRVVGAYAVTIKTQPATATCQVANGSGVASANVSNVQVSCTPTFSLGGSIAGIPAGEKVRLANGADTLELQTDGSFVMPGRVTGNYTLTVQLQPASAFCSIVGATGVATADVTAIAVTCAPFYSVGGTVSGLPASSTVRLQNGSDTLDVSANGTFAMPAKVMGAYSVTVQTSPAGYTCTVTNGAGVATANVTNIAVNCVAGYLIGGSLSGLLSAHTVTLLNNGADALSLGANGGFTFATPATSYDVTVGTQPAHGYCTASSNTGTASAAVSSVQVACTPPGTLDSTFNGSGFITMSPGPLQNEWYRFVQEADGALVWVGRDQSVSNDEDWIISKLAPGGTLDPSFGTGGHLKVPNRAAMLERAKAISKAADGGYWVVGSLISAFDFDMAVARVTAAGALDTSYNDGGVQQFNLGAWGYADDMVTLSDGSMVLVGREGDNASLASATMIKLTPSGQRDLSFGTGGVVSYDNPSVIDALYAVALIPGTDTIIAVGASGNDTLIMSVSANGTPTASFGTNGVLVTDFSDTMDIDFARGLVVSATTITIAGHLQTGSGLSDLMGQVDLTGQRTTFGTNGRAFIGQGDLFSITQAPGGGFYVGGSNGLFGVVMRVNANGSVDTNFATNGRFESKLGLFSLTFNDIELDARGRIVTGGMMGAVNNPDLGAMRLLP